VSALRIATPHEPVRFIDLGPASRPYPLKGTATLRGRLCVPETTVRWRSEDSRAAARVQAFRKRNGGRVAK
jgi:hypothetical protein